MTALNAAPQIPAPETIRSVTREIISRPEFAAPPPWDEVLLSLLKLGREWLEALASWSAANPELARILFIGAVLVLVGCLAHLLYLALGDLLPFKRGKDAAAHRRSRWEILEGTATNWREALEVARRMLKEGDHRRAIWIVHRVFLGMLDEQGAIQFAGWKTNSHYLRECAGSHPWYVTFAELTDAYERAIYAHRAAVASSIEGLVLRIDRMCKERLA
jgi:hypothetical protein